MIFIVKFIFLRHGSFVQNENLWIPSLHGLEILTELCDFKYYYYFYYYNYLVCEATGTAATPGLLSQPRVIMKMIVEKQMERRLAGETEVLEENLPQRHFCPSQNRT
jgi:hypothetical protein